MSHDPTATPHPGSYECLLDVATRRRSVRQFKSDPVPDEYIACGGGDFRTDEQVEAYALVTKAWCMGEH
jgi:hypothetical protein